MTRSIRTASWALLCAVLGCEAGTSGTTPTQVIVDIEPDAALRPLVAQLQVTVSGSDSRGDLDRRLERLQETTRPGEPGEPEWPVRIALVPRDGDAQRVFELTAAALDAEGEFLAEARLVTGYVINQARYARLVIEASCVGIHCDPLETCTAMRCQDAWQDPDALERYVGQREESMVGDAGMLVPVEPDAGLDAGTNAGTDADAPIDEQPDPPVDAGSDAGDAAPRTDTGAPDAAPSVDACATDHGGCDLLVTCTSTDGVASCSACPGGYTDDNGDGTSCTDIDECLTNEGGCDAAHGVCTNSEGSHSCACEPGYNGSGLECSMNATCVTAVDCAPQATCQRIGSLDLCVCGSGYTGNGAICNDVLECATGNGGCDQSPMATCNEVVGGPPTCSCPSFYMGSGIGSSGCSDVLECATGNGGCDQSPMATCNEVVGGTPTCSCPSFYMGSGIGSSGCTDVLECATGNGGCDTSPMATCNEVAGGTPTCTCPGGYMGSGVGSSGCTDVLECATGNGGCDTSPMATCNEVVGGNPTCSCPSFYMGSGVGSSGCNDVLECAAGNGGCDTSPMATCNEVAGGNPTCSCPSFYMGSGVGSSGCNDVLECATGNGGCDTNPMATCNETVGGTPTCTCPGGYMGSGVGSSGCTNVDECTLNMDNCHANATCTDTTGSFTCACTCGYAGSGMSCSPSVINLGNAPNPSVYTGSLSLAGGTLYGYRVRNVPGTDLLNFGIVSRSSGVTARFALYTNTGSNLPGTRVAQGPMSGSALSVGTNLGLSASACAALPAGDYWVFVIANTGFDVASNPSGSEATCYVTSFGFGTAFPTTFPGCTAPSPVGAQPFNLYMVVD